jgi:putative spermidine/putrescine transport system permease protein
LLTALVIGFPLVLLTTYSFRESSFLGVGTGPTLEQYKVVFESAGTVRLMLNTLMVSLIVGAIATALAFVVAYGITFRLGRRTALIALGIVVASGVASFLVRIFAWGIVLGTNGLINSSLEAIGVIGQPLEWLYFDRFAIAVTMVYAYLPISALIVYSAMQEIDPRSVEASRDLGAGRWRTLFAVVMPQAKAGLLAAFAITVILAGGDFVTPRIVGGTSGLMVGAVVESLALTGGDLPGAAALALAFLVMLIGAVGLIALAFKLIGPVVRRISLVAQPAARSLTQRAPRLRFRYSLSLPGALLLLVYMTVPTILVIIFSFNSSPNVGLPLTGFTTHWYPNIVGKVGFTEALKGSVTITTLATIGSLLIGIPVAFALVRAGKLGERLLWAAVLVPFVIPGALIGSALLIATDETGVRPGVALTTIVHVVLLVSVVVIVVYARLVGVDKHLTEAARDLGSSVWRAFRTVTLPLLLPSIIGAAVLGAAYSLDEIFITTFTIGSDNTVPIWLYGQARRGFTPGVNALGVLLLVGTLTAFTLAVTVARRSILDRRE